MQPTRIFVCRDVGAIGWGRNEGVMVESELGGGEYGDRWNGGVWVVRVFISKYRNRLVFFGRMTFG